MGFPIVLHFYILIYFVSITKLIDLNLNVYNLLTKTTETTLAYSNIRGR